MDWSKGYSSAFYVKEVDPTTWRDMRDIQITGGTVRRTLTGLRNSATINCSTDIGGIEKWIRIYMDVVQNGDHAHEAIFTGLAASPKRRTYSSRTDYSPNCYSVLEPANDVILPRGWYALAGQNCGELIRQLLSVSPAPIVIEDDSPLLSTTIIAEDEETCLSMIDKILDAMNWYLDVFGDGTIHIRPYDIRSVITLDPTSYDIIEAPINVVEDWYSAPNVYMAISGDLVGIAKDNREDSSLSIINRGREVWAKESGISLSDGETINEYAQRQLLAAQRVRKSVSYDRRYVPQIRPGSVINLHYPAQKVDGLYLVTSQNIKLGFNARTSESVEEL